MTEQEFSDQFDVLYNNITSNQAPGLNEYEKSIFLTKGQDEVVKNYLSPKSNPKQDGFDGSLKRQADFSTIIENKVLLNINSIDKFDQRSIAYALPSDLFISLNEQLMSGTTPIVVVPLSYEEYNRVMAKPYKYPPKYQAWRLITKNNYNVEHEYPAYAEEAIGSTFYYSDKKIGIKVTKLYAVTLKVNILSQDESTDYDGTAASLQEYFMPVITGSAENGYTITITMPYNCYFRDYREACINSNTSFWEHVNALTWPWEDYSSEDADAYKDDIKELCGQIAVVTAMGEDKRYATIVEIIGRFAVTPTYRIRYVRKPKPIILTELYDIQNELTIDGEHEPMTSELPSELHEEILQRAVELAKVAWAGSQEEIAATQLAISTGQRSE